MGRAAKREHLHRLLYSHAQSIHDTFQLLDQPAAASLEKTDWSEVMKLGDEISKQAAVCGMLSTGSTPEMRDMEEHIGTYCNLLLGLLLLCQGSSVGAGATLQACIRSSAKLVIDHSLSLLGEAVSSYGSSASKEKNSIPSLSGRVWEACAALKKSPSTNSMAVTRALSQVGISVKDVLRELSELRPAAVATGGAVADEGDEDELSPEEMEVAKLAVGAASGALAVVKEAMRFAGSGMAPVEVLEGILGKVQAVGVQVDELGATVFPPQEMEKMAEAAEEMRRLAAGIEDEVRGGAGADGLFGALEVFVGSLGSLLGIAVNPEAGIERELRTLSL